MTCASTFLPSPFKKKKVMSNAPSTYQNATSVADQVNHIKSLNNLLLWYTADEPDGTSDPLDATVKASHLISSLDGGQGRVSGRSFSTVKMTHWMMVKVKCLGTILYRSFSTVKITFSSTCFHPKTFFTISIIIMIFFSSYAAGCDIVLQDTYMIGNNVTFSSVWDTPCTPTFGDCGSALSLASHFPLTFVCV